MVLHLFQCFGFHHNMQNMQGLLVVLQLTLFGELESQAMFMRNLDINISLPLPVYKELFIR